MASEITPNDTRGHVIRIISEIVTTPHQNITVDVIYTDDYHKDHHCLEEHFEIVLRKKVMITKRTIDKCICIGTSHLSGYLACRTAN